MINFPNIEPDGVTFGLESNTTSFVSDLNATVQHAALPGDKWVFSLTFSNRGKQEARILNAFKTSMLGESGRFTMSPPDLDNQGLGVSGLVNGAGQTGRQVATDGWPNNTAILKIGDYIQIGNELKMVTADANSNGTGQATINFTPPLRKATVNNAIINASTPKAVFYLSGGTSGNWTVKAPYIYTTAFSGEEDIL